MEKLQYMVVFSLPSVLSEEFIQLIPEQRQVIDEWLIQGKILSYSLSLDSNQLWIVALATNRSQLKKMLHKLPLFRHMAHKISLLTFHNVISAPIPAISLN